MNTAPIILTPAEVEQRTRAVFEIWNSLDPNKIADLYSGGYGFGYRTRDPRPPHPTKEIYRKGLELWLESLVSYRIAIDAIHTAIEGDIGLAWGFYHEELQTRGGEKEILQGRFSETMRRDANGWRTLFYHRDMTPFNDQGVYIPLPLSIQTS